MITIDKVTYRNLQEQVEKNKQDIEAWTNIQFTLNNMGIRVLGKVKQPSDIPPGPREFGDAYLVGISEPYDIYIYTRTLTPGLDGVFINMGPLSIVGPEGPAGPAGEQGQNGERGSKIFTGQVSPASLTTTDYIEGDVYIRLTSENSFNGDVYQYKNLTWTKVGNIEGPQGDQGIQGNTPYIENSYWYINGVNTNVKAEGVDGKNGKDGKDGIVFNILGELASTTLLPDPSTKNEYDAYLVGNNTDGYVLYVVVDGAWKKISFSTGTQVYDGQTSVTTYDVTKLKPKAIQFKSPTIVQKSNDLGGYAITGTGIYQSQDPYVAYNLDNTTIVLPLQDTSDIAFNINNNKIEAKLTSTVNNKINNALTKPEYAPTSTKVVAIDTANSQTLIPIDDVPISTSANLITSGGVYTAINGLNTGKIVKLHDDINIYINNGNPIELNLDFDTMMLNYSSILVLAHISDYSTAWSALIPTDLLYTNIENNHHAHWLRPLMLSEYNSNTNIPSGAAYWVIASCELRLEKNPNTNKIQVVGNSGYIYETKFKSSGSNSSRTALGSNANVQLEIYGIRK